MGGCCFWCMEALFDALEGVECVVSGYAGDNTNNSVYREVCRGNTGHADVVQFCFDLAVLSYGDLLRMFLVMHNPTIRSRQGAYNNGHYRSVIFYHSEEQGHAAKAIIQERRHLFEKPILTIIAPYTEFYKAEEHHQQYYKKIWEKRIVRPL